MNKRAVIYARVSTDKQRGNYSVPSQVAECMRYAQNNGYVIVGDRYVNPETGKDVAPSNDAVPAYVDDHSSLEINRPGLDAVYEYLESYGFDVVIVYSIDRLDRDPYKLRVHEYGFMRLGAKVEFVNGDYSDTPEGKFMKNVVASAAQLENDWRTERFNRGKRRKASNGIYVHGRPPFGYVPDPKADSGLKVNEEQAVVIKQIFELFVNKMYSIQGIAEELNKQGEVLPQRSKKWAKSSVGNILRNTAYIGIVYYNKSKSSGKGEKGKGRVFRSRDDWIKISIPPIVDEDLFNEAGRRLKLNGKSKRSIPKREYLLSGMIFCEECGKAYYCETTPAGKHRRKNNAPFYRHRKKHGHCLNRMVSARKLDPKVWNKIVCLLLHPESLKEGYEQALEQERVAQTRQREILEKLYLELDKLQKTLQNLTDAYADPDIDMSKSEFIAHRVKIDNEKNGLGERVREIEAELSNLPTPEEFESLEQFAIEVKERLTSDHWQPSLRNKRQILELLHVRVILDRNGDGRIVGWFGEMHGLSSITYFSSVPLVLARPCWRAPCLVSCRA